MKKSLFVALGFFMFILYGCNVVDESPVDESFESFSNEVQKDKLFEEYSKAFQNQVNLTLTNSNNSAVFDKSVFQTDTASVKSKEDYLRLVEKAGVSNPGEKMEALLHLMKTQKALFDKYPRMLQLTKTEFDLLMYNSNRQISIGLIKRRYGTSIK